MQIQQVATLDKGNVLVSLPADFFETFSELLNYYRQNEEAKKEDTGGELVTVKIFAALTQKSEQTVRRWCKNIIADSVSGTGASILIDKPKALELLKNHRNNPSPALSITQSSPTTARKRKRYTKPLNKTA